MKDAYIPTEDHILNDDLAARVRAGLGIPDLIGNNVGGLRAVYAAWCSHVPFDNMRKMISLRSGSDKALAGLDAEDFFENYLAHGSGGTCWPSSNALYTLLKALGFSARRAAGSMFDMPDINHGTVKVDLDAQDWLADSSMLTYEPFPLTDQTYIKEGQNAVEAEIDEGEHMIWVDFPPVSEFIPCRLRLDPVGDDFYLERYEVFSRTQSPFNDKLYFRKGGPDGITVIFGNTRFRRTDDGGLDVKPFDRDGLCNYLAEEMGVSKELVGRWVESGSLESTFAETERPPSPEIKRPRPSRR